MRDRKLKILGVGALAGILAITLFLCVLPSSTAEYLEPNEYMVIILGENRLYEDGDNVTIEILFYNEDVPTDADDINVSFRYPEERYIEKEPTRLSTGHYTLTFQIYEEDFDLQSRATVWVRCTVEDARGEGTAAERYIRINQRVPDLQAQLTVDKPTFGRGENVTFELRVTTNGILVDADKVETIFKENGVTVKYEGESVGTMIRQEEGIYHYYYESPDDTQSREIILRVWVTLGNQKIYGIEIMAVKKYFDVWLHIDEQTPTSLDGKIGVNDLTGQPVASDVFIEYWYNNITGKRTTVTLTGETGSHGLMDIDFVYEDIRPEISHLFSLTINATENSTRNEEPRSQIVHIHLRRETEITPPSGYGVRPLFDRGDPLPTDSPVQLEYLVGWNGSAMPDKEVITYLFTDSYQDDVPGGEQDGSMGELFGMYRHTTDSEGKFLLEFTTPPSPIRIQTLWKIYDLEPGSGTWDEPEEESLLVTDSYHRSEDLDIEVENFGSGQEATVTLTLPGLEAGTAEVLIQCIDPSQTANIEDIPFTALETEMFGDTSVPVYRLNEPFYEDFTGDTYQTTVAVPSFAPGENHFIIVGVIETDLGSSGRSLYYQEVHWNYLVIDINGTKVHDRDPLMITTDAPVTMDEEDSTEITITVTEGPGAGGDAVEGASVLIDVVGPAGVSVSTGTTNAEGKVTFTLTAQNVTGNATVTLYMNSPKDGYIGGSYVTTISIIADSQIDGGGNGNGEGPGDDDESGGTLWLVVVVVLGVVVIMILYFIGFIPGGSIGYGESGEDEPRAGEGSEATDDTEDSDTEDDSSEADPKEESPED